MTKQFTIKEALKLVSFKLNERGNWTVDAVYGNVGGDVEGSILGNVKGHVGGDVEGHVEGSILGNVKGHVGGDVEGDVEGSILGNVDGTINGRQWKFIETPKEKLKRLIEETDNDELIEAFNQLEEITE